MNQVPPMRLELSQLNKAKLYFQYILKVQKLYVLLTRYEIRGS
jgi:hypothetical protein